MSENGNTKLKDNADIGTVKIADDVVARIAGLAAMEVEGVSAAAGDITAEQISRAGKSALSKGVKVQLSGGSVTADLNLIMGYGYNIPSTCRQVQTRVKAAIGNMTGLVVQDVNVHVAGIKMPV